MTRSWAYNRFGVLMGTSGRASGPRWPSLRGDVLPMITLFPSQGDFCVTAIWEFFELFLTDLNHVFSWELWEYIPQYVRLLFQQSLHNMELLHHRTHLHQG